MPCVYHRRNSPAAIFMKFLSFLCILIFPIACLKIEKNPYDATTSAGMLDAFLLNGYAPPCGTYGPAQMLNGGLMRQYSLSIDSPGNLQLGTPMFANLGGCSPSSYTSSVGDSGLWSYDFKGRSNFFSNTVTGVTYKGSYFYLGEALTLFRIECPMAGTGSEDTTLTYDFFGRLTVFSQSLPQDCLSAGSPPSPLSSNLYWTYSDNSTRPASISSDAVSVSPCGSNNTTCLYSYLLDPSGRIAQITMTLSGSATSAVDTFTYGPSGELLSDDCASPATDCPQGTATFSTTYTYDSSLRLLQSNPSLGNINTFSFDAAGKLSQWVNGATTYTFTN